MTSDQNLSHSDPVWEGIRQMAKRLFKSSRDRGDLTARDVGIWRSVWPDATPGQIADALVAHSRAGNAWMPEAGELAGYLGGAPTDAVDFSTVLGALDGARFLGRSGAVQRMRERAGETAAAWMCSEGIDALKAMELAHPEFGPSVRRDLERRYLAFVKTAEADVRRGLPAPSASDRGELGSGRGTGGLRRLDFSQGQQLISGPGEAA